MAVQIINGIPGSGKTLYSVYLATKHYQKENKFIIKLFRFIGFYIKKGIVFCFNKLPFKKKLKEPINIYEIWYPNKRGLNKYGINNVYSNVSIILDKKNNVYSNEISFWDLDNSKSFLPYSLIVIDEIQSYVDSEEFRNFPKDIARFLQWHRHFKIKDILFISQHPSRVAKKIRNLTNEFIKVKYFGQIPILNLFPILNRIGFFKADIYYELEEYGKSTKIDKKYANYDFKKKWFFCNIKDYWSRYDTFMLSEYNENKPLYYDNEYKSLKLTEEEIIEKFPLI